MQASFETYIQEALKKHTQFDLAVDQLLKLWRDRGCSQSDTKSLFLFLLNAGYHLTLCSQLQFLLDKKLALPWLFLIELYYEYRAGLEFSRQDFLDVLFTAVDSNTLQEIIRFTKYDTIDGRFMRLRSDWIEKELEAKHLRKKEILNKLSLLKHERMLDEERKLFISTLEEFPTDEEILTKYGDFQVRYADYVFQKQETKKDKTWKKLFRKDAESTDDMYIASMLSLAKKHPKETYWIASSLFLAECYGACIDLLAKKKQLSAEEKWLLLDSYIQDERYVLALEYSRQLEDEYRNQPDHLMACLYNQAIALEKLGKKSEAIQILSSILTYNKNFKMAQYLHDEWSK